MALTDLFSKDASPENAQKVIKRLSAQMHVNQQLSGLTSLDELLWKSGEARELVEAEKLFIYAIHEDDLITRSAESDANKKGKLHRVPTKGKSIPAYVARTAEVVSIANVGDAKEIKSISGDLSYDGKIFLGIHGKNVKQLLAAPIVYQGTTIGVMEAVNKETGEEFDFMDVACIQEAAKNLAPMMHQVSVMQMQSDKLTYTEQYNRITQRIHAARDIDQILLSVWRDLLEMFGVERLTIYAVDHENNELYSKAKGDDGGIKEIRVTIDHGSISGYVAATRSVVNIVDVYDLDELARIDHELVFNQSFDKVTGLRTRQVLAAPLEFDGQIHGVIQLINTSSGEPFSDRDVESVHAISQALAIAMANRAHTAVSAVRTHWDKLFRDKLLNAAQLANAKAIASENALFLEDVLIEEFKLSRQAILESYSEYCRRPSVDCDDYATISAEIINKATHLYDQLKTDTWCPLEIKDGKVIIAIDDPRDLGRIDAIQAHFPGLRVDFRVSLQSQIIRMIDRWFRHGTMGAPGATGTFSTTDIKRSTQRSQAKGAEAKEEEVDPEELVLRAKAREEQKKAQTVNAITHINSELERLADLRNEDEAGAKLVKLVNLIIEKAYHEGASDIHIEPYLEHDLVVRYRVDGDLHTVMPIKKDLRNAVVSRIKIMSELDIAERRIPQDGKIKFSKFGRLDIELRVATLPTVGGCEDVVMRILAASKPIPLSQMGMSERNYSEFIKLIEEPYGIILCVGPTGSGKTTTLHSALGHINRDDVKIWTAEDPVEITQKGLRQVQVNVKAGLNFATAMRSFLRADPDVIMVGEMRDQETTKMGIEASLTGHLVMSTLHTNNAPETITRLLNMEVDTFAFGDALLGILAQRLGRTLCKACKEEYRPSREEYDELRKEYGSEKFWTHLKVPPAGELKLNRAKEGGCVECKGSGYKGRTGIHELLVRSDEIRELIYKKEIAEDIRQVAMEQGMRTLKQDGIEKILMGITDLRQVRSVCST